MGGVLVKTRFPKRQGSRVSRRPLDRQAQRTSEPGAAEVLEYFVLDWREYNLPVYPIAVLSYRRVAQPSRTSRLT